MNVLPKWLGHLIVDHKHVADLESKAGEHEFLHGHPASHAEQLALKEYYLDNHLDAAAHHMSNLRSHANQGNKGIANNHERMYKLHLGQLAQIDPQTYTTNTLEPHPNITAKVKKDLKASDRYSPHKADQLLFGFGGPNDDSKKSQ
jgi:hypothetical protein